MMAWSESRRTVSSSFSEDVRICWVNVKEGKLTGCFDESGVMLDGQKRVGEIAEELLEETSDRVDIVVEVFWVAEVNT